MKLILLFTIFCSILSCKNSNFDVTQKNFSSSFSENKKKLSGQNKINRNDYTILTDSLNIEEQLIKHKLPGFSLVVFQDYQIIYANQWGVKSAISKMEIDENTAFSTASIAKPITALLCFILEEKGLIDLNKPIDGYLRRWQVPENPFLEKNRPTWKNFLNHTAGTTQHGFADFYEGDEIPTLKQSLLGQLPRYNNEEISFLFEPGSSWSYSGGGYVIIQMALEDHFNTPIAKLAEKHIFKPLDLSYTTMNQPNESEFLYNVALVHDDEGKVIKTGLPVTPQVAPSGLWSTPKDLAKLTIELQKALRNDSNFISLDVAKELTEVSALKDAVGGWSYGWQRSFGFNNYDWFMHNGSNTGVGGDIFATMTDGNGFIFLANGEKANRFPVIDNTRIKILSMMNWNKEISENEKQEIPSDLKKCLLGGQEDFLYGLGLPTKVVERNDKVYIQSSFFQEFLGREDSELIYLKTGQFKILDYPNFLEFECEDGDLKAVVVLKNGLKNRIETKQQEE